MYLCKVKTLNDLIYNYQITKAINNGNTIKLLDTKPLNDFIKAIRAKKKYEDHHRYDSINEAYRWRTGIGGEMALEQMLGEKFVDLSIGESKDYHVPDLSKLGIDVGVKSVDKGRYPVIFKKSEKPEIIILRISDDTFSVLGVVLPEDLNKHQDDSLILSPALRARGTKTAFTGFHKIKPFNNLEQLKSII